MSSVSNPERENATKKAIKEKREREKVTPEIEITFLLYLGLYECQWDLKITHCVHKPKMSRIKFSFNHMLKKTKPSTTKELPDSYNVLCICASNQSFGIKDTSLKLFCWIIIFFYRQSIFILIWDQKTGLDWLARAQFLSKSIMLIRTLNVLSAILRVFFKGFIINNSSLNNV